MNHIQFSAHDIDQINQSGLTLENIQSQLAMFRQGTPYAVLDRPCTVGDGIKQLSGDDIDQCLHLYDTRGQKKDLVKFVPASGAATRMFKDLIHACQAINNFQNHRMLPESIRSTLSFLMDHCHQFAFYEKLKASLAEDGIRIDPLLAEKDPAPILSHLLGEKYLNYAGLPKGLISFHTYENHTRTAFEEHLVEAAAYVRIDAGKCRLHFTVPPAFQTAFASFFHKIRGRYERDYDTTLEVSFSTQEPSTNTIAVDTDNRPFRLSNGRLLFRPGGHGALINNLNRLEADIVFIKNIDNVAHERFIPEMIQWKKILCGYLILCQDQIFNFLNALQKEPADNTLTEKIRGFLETDLGCRMPNDFNTLSDEKKRRHLIRLLDRPIRVCGMVPNTGAPGGGPFWVRGDDSSKSLQIVETSQINSNDPQQEAILNRLTYFNPVDLVCGIKNRQGNYFDLSNYVDHQAVFISSKSENGKALKALELPGLWNGAMAFWNTVFVEVPKITFNPVKEFNDLLRECHQPPVV